MHNNLRKWEKIDLSRKERTLLHPTQQISKFLQGKTSNLKGINTPLLSPNCYLCSCTSWICVCACIIFFSPLMSSLKLCKNFDFSFSTIFSGEELVVKLCDKLVKSKKLGHKAVAFHHCKPSMLPACGFFCLSSPHWREHVGDCWEIANCVCGMGNIS